MGMGICLDEVLSREKAECSELTRANPSIKYILRRETSPMGEDFINKYYQPDFTFTPTSTTGIVNSNFDNLYYQKVKKLAKTLVDNTLYNKEIVVKSGLPYTFEVPIGFDRGFVNVPFIDKVVYNDPATIVFWTDGSKTVVKTHEEAFSKEHGLAMAIAKKYFGTRAKFKKAVKEATVQEKGDK